MQGAKTLKQWNDEGRRICKGAKMCGRNEIGVPVFDPLDTYDPNAYRPRRVRASRGRFWGSGYYRSHGGDWDSDPGWSDLGIESFQG